MGSSPLLLSYVSKKLTINQPLDDCTYLAFSMFGLSCIEYAVSWGGNQYPIEFSDKKKLISQLPQFILILFLIGKLDPNKYIFDKELMLLGYSLAISSVIWSEKMAVFEYQLTITNKNLTNNFQSLFIIAVKSILYMSISCILTFIVSLFIDFKNEISVIATVFFGLLGFVILIFDKYERISKKTG